MLYACDRPWWETYNPDFDGLKVIGHGTWPGALSANVVHSPTMIWDRNAIGAGGNSGFQAINLVARWGAKRIILTGFDFQDAGNHWHGRHPDHLAQTRDETVKLWRQHMDLAAPDLASRGITVLNATRSTALTCFERVSMGKALG